MELRPNFPHRCTLERARLHLGALLVRDGCSRPSRLEDALAVKEQTGARLGEIVVERGWHDSAQLARRTRGAARARVRATSTRVEIEPRPPWPAAGASRAPLRRAAGPLPRRRTTVLVAVADPTNVAHLRRPAPRARAQRPDRRRRGGRAREGAIAPRLPHGRRDRTESDADEDQAAWTTSATSRRRARPRSSSSTRSIARAIDDGRLRHPLRAAGRRRSIVRARVDGVTRDLATMPQELQPAVTSRLKIMGELDIAERRSPQDGRVSVRVGGAADGPPHRGAADDVRRAGRAPDPAPGRRSRIGARGARHERPPPSETFAPRDRPALRRGASPSARPAAARRPRSTPRSTA